MSEFFTVSAHTPCTSEQAGPAGDRVKAPTCSPQLGDFNFFFSAKLLEKGGERKAREESGTPFAGRRHKR